jgi:hypothetical protein
MYLLRIDDFPAWTENMDQFVPAADFEIFHDVLRSHEIPYMIGVTPQPALSPLDPADTRTRQLSSQECRLLQRISREGATIGLHGVTHHTRQARQHSEFAEIDDGFFQDLVQYADLELQRLIGIRAEVFVPPFNRITLRQLDILSGRFRAICGGPESCPALGAPIIREIGNGARYIPSVSPYYGRAHEILPHVSTERQECLCITLHWEWERRRGYEELESLCGILAGHVAGWGALLAA